MCRPEVKKEKSRVQLLVEQLPARSDFLDLLCFLLPALLFKVTNVYPIYFTGILRIISTHLTLSLHYSYVDKDNYQEKISQKQLQRERKDYLVGIVLHMWAQAFLQIVFPGMFFTSTKTIMECSINTLLSHVIVVEPLYYAVHRWLHVPEQMKAMHSHHHLSINPVPSTSLVQDFQEHFIYIATFGPALLLPFFVGGANHWLVIAAYLVLFDLVNAYGHTNIRCRHWIFENKWSPIRYLIYTPEFHLGHHAFYTCNYGLFMPIWDHLFSTYREYKKAAPKLLPIDKQDFVFIGHNGGLGHLLTVPEISVYNMYDAYLQTWFPIELELLLVSCANHIFRLFSSSYRVPRYLVDGKLVGRIICLLRTPIDYANKDTYSSINKEIVSLIRDQHRNCGTTFFGLGNLNKMKQLNDGGSVIADMVNQDSYLKDKNIRIWTGDTLTAASVYHQVLAIPNVKEIFYIGANGKIGNAVCKLLADKGIKICIFSKFVGLTHVNISYTQDMVDMAAYKYVLIGKILKPSMYQKAFKSRRAQQTGGAVEQQYLLDYTVPYMPLKAEGVQHIQIGVLTVSDKNFLQGYFDICMGTDQNQIYPCHAGCILNMVEKRQIDETGDIDASAVVPWWNKAKSYGLDNKHIVFA